MRVGLALYSVRDECERDFRGVLRSVAEMGYAGVEFTDLHGFEAHSVRALLEGVGLEACGRHTSLEIIETDLQALAADASELGVKRIIVSSPPVQSAEEGRTLRARLVLAAQRVADVGLRLGFHNHDYELRRDDTGWCFFNGLREGNPELLFLELDLGWAWYAGEDPFVLLREAGLPCPLVHVKDFRTRGELSFCPVGDGVVGYDQRLPRAAASAGVEWLLVEQDRWEASSLDAARRSLVHVRRVLEEDTRA